MNPASEQSATFTPVVYVVEDDGPSRLGIVRLLQSFAMEARSFASASDFVNGFDANRPACLVLDVCLPTMSGLQLQQLLQLRGFDIPIVMISGRLETRHAVQAMKQGAIDYIEKPLSPQRFIDVVQRARNESIKRFQSWTKRFNLYKRIAMLSIREQEILEKLSRGDCVNIIADDLQLSPKTVYVHRSNLFRKLKIDSIMDLVRDGAMGNSDPLEVIKAAAIMNPQSFHRGQSPTNRPSAASSN